MGTLAVRWQMRRFRAALVAACMVALGSSPLSAADVPDPVGVGGRVVVPEAGYAITFPDAWVWVRQSDVEIGELLVRISDLAGADFAEAMREGLPLMGHPGASIIAMPYPFDEDAGQLCRLGSTPGTPPGPVAAAVVSGLEEHGTVEPGTVAVTEMALPAGKATRFDYGEEMDHAYYVLVNEDLYFVYCTAWIPPDDRWVSIAETFEFLAVKDE